MAGKVRKISIDFKGKIPWVNVEGPIKDVLVSENLYILLKNDPRVRSKMTESPIDDVKPVEDTKEDEVTASINTEISIEKSETKEEAEASTDATNESDTVILNDKVELQKEEVSIADNGDIIPSENTDDIENSPLAETDTNVEEPEIDIDAESDMIDSAMDTILETLADETEEAEFGNPAAIVEAVNEVEKIEASEDIESDTDLKKALYTEEELKALSKTQLKEICVNKGIRTLYHDRIPNLIAKILEAN